MPDYVYFPYFGDAVRVIRELRGLTQDEVGGMMGVGKQQAGKYEKNSARPSLDSLGALLEQTGITLIEFATLMQFLEHLGEGKGWGGLQYDLWSVADSEVREPGEVEWVTRILYLTDRGRLLALDDPTLNRFLTTSLAAQKPRKELLLTLKAPVPTAPREPRPPRRRKAKKRPKS